MAEAAFDTRIVGADGTYSVVLSPDFVTPLGGPFGGYLATLLLRAAGMHATLPRPVSLHCQFLNAAAIDRVDVSTVTLRSSSRAHAVRVSMTQSDKPIAEGIVWFSAKLEGLDHGPVAVPSPPHPETLRSIEELFTDYTPTGFSAQLDLRPRTGELRATP